MTVLWVLLRHAEMPRLLLVLVLLLRLLLLPLLLAAALRVVVVVGVVGVRAAGRRHGAVAPLR